MGHFRIGNLPSFALVIALLPAVTINNFQYPRLRTNFDRYCTKSISGSRSYHYGDSVIVVSPPVRDAACYVHHTLKLDKFPNSA
jgi:hypothetical protein